MALSKFKTWQQNWVLIGAEFLIGITILPMIDLWHGHWMALAFIPLICWRNFLPEVRRLDSPSGNSHLLSYRWSFGWMIFFMGTLGCALLISNLQDFESRHFGTWGVSFLISIFFLIPICMIFCFLWSFHIVIVKRWNKTESCYVKWCVQHTSQADYLWLNDHRLLIAQSDEHYWYLYLQDLDAGKSEAYFPFNIVLGRTPRLRKVTLISDWQWLEELWHQHQLHSADFAEPPEENRIPVKACLRNLFYISPKEVAAGNKSHSSSVRDFFTNHMWHCDGFPFHDYLMTRFDGSTTTDKRVLTSIPPQSRFCRDLADLCGRKIALRSELRHFFGYDTK